jgi:hypothetical protein
MNVNKVVYHLFHCQLQPLTLDSAVPQAVSRRFPTAVALRVCESPYILLPA